MVSLRVKRAAIRIPGFDSPLLHGVRVRFSPAPPPPPSPPTRTSLEASCRPTRKQDRETMCGIRKRRFSSSQFWSSLGDYSCGVLAFVLRAILRCLPRADRQAPRQAPPSNPPQRPPRPRQRPCGTLSHGATKRGEPCTTTHARVPVTYTELRPTCAPVRCVHVVKPYGCTLERIGVISFDCSDSEPPPWCSL